MREERMDKKRVEPVLHHINAFRSSQIPLWNSFINLIIFRAIAPAVVRLKL
jgi:hypothetical protein